MAPPRKKPWGGRFQAATHEAVERFSASVDFDRALVRYDLRVSMAHARMLAAQGLIGANDQQQIQTGLEQIAAEV